MTEVKMNQSDDDIFGRNIDQLDRETPRYNLSEEENERDSAVNNHVEKKMSSSSQKPPSVASVQPYSRPSNINPVMSPHLLKKNISNDISRATPPSSAPYYPQRYPPTHSSNAYINPPPFQQGNPPQPPHFQQTNPPQPPQQHMVRSMNRPPHHPQLPSHHAQYHANPLMREPTPEQPCYCPDCIHPLQQSQQQQKNESQKIEDEILLRQRELDSCWQEDELDCPMDFTEIDRQKENKYAEKKPVTNSNDISLLRENKGIGNIPTSFNTSIPRDYPASSTTGQVIGTTYGNTPLMKTKQQAVVSPFPRNIQKKVNINNVVSQFNYSDEPEAPQDFTSGTWPQSELGSRIPSMERINLSPCLSAVQSGIQTPAEPGTGQKPLNLVETNETSPTLAVSNGNQASNTLKNNVPTATPLHQLPGHDSKRKINILDRFRGNEQYTRSIAVQPTQDSVKDFTSGRWVQSEMGSRIPSSEMISLSPLTMSGIPSGIQTPAEPSSGQIPLSAQTNVEKEHSSALEEENQQNDYDALKQRRGSVHDSSEEHEVNSDGVKLRRKKNDTSKGGEPKLTELMSRMKIDNGEVPRYDYIEQDSVKNFGQPEQSSRFQSYENLSFNPTYSANTSGLVTPCEHSSIYGGAKPLRQIPRVEETENGEVEDFISSIGSVSDPENLDKTHELLEEHHSQDGAVEGHPKPEVKQVDEAARLPEDAHKKQCENKSSKQPTAVSKSILKNPNNNNQPKMLHRKTSWSSQESGHSNRTDISTVVNAPMSMHNTAPASPDPDGSEASDSAVTSDIEGHEGDTYAPQYPPPQKRWLPPNEPEKRVQGGEVDHTSRMHLNPVQDLIQMAKQQFSNHPSNPTHPNSNNTGEMQPPHHLPHPRQMRFTSHNHAHFNHRPPSGMYPHAQHTYRGMSMNSHERMMNPRFGYSPNPHQPYRSPHLLRPPYGGMHAGPYHGNRQHPTIQGPPSMPPYPGPGSGPPSEHQHGMNPRYIPMHQPRHFMPPHLHQHHVPRPPHANEQPLNDFHLTQQQPPPQHNEVNNVQPPPPVMQQQTSIPTIPTQSQPQQTQQPPQPQPQQLQDDKAPPVCSGEQTIQQHRVYSTTSRDTNRASPPHTDSLDTASVMSFASMAASHQNLDTKTDMVSSLLSMLGTHDSDDMSRTLYAMSSSADSCAAMRQSNCLPLLIQLLHSENKDTGTINWATRQRASKALHNIVYANNGDRRGKREMRVLRLLENIRTHTEHILQQQENFHTSAPSLRDHGPGPAVAAIMKLSFQDELKNTICELGGLQTICELLAVEYKNNRDSSDPYTIALRKYAGMVLINLTYNDANNKAVLCSMTNTLAAIIGQLHYAGEEDLVQVFAGITRNISWRPDDRTQQALKAINAVRALMTCIQNLLSEVCIRAVLSAVWNLSAHNSENKEEICRTPGSLKYLTYALSYQSPTNTLAVVENAGGILRNVSSHIAVNSDYRRILRQEGCLETLVRHLRSPSTRIVSNACGVLWNLSARCVEDQDVLWELGAVSVLKTLVHSKHKSISASSAAALRNLLAVKPGSSSTDTESQLSFHHRSNSLPMRGHNRRGDKKYRSSDSEQRKDGMKVNGKITGESRNMEHYYDAYQQQQQYRNATSNDIRSPIIEEVGSPPTYNEATGSVPKLYGLYKREDSFVSETTPSQYFVPEPLRLPMSAPTNRRALKDRDSSSSCSSFSPNDVLKPMSYRSTERSKEDFVDLPDELDEKDTKSIDAVFLTEERKSQNTTERSNQGSMDFKPYDDCKKSVAKDAVMIYQGTPKLPQKASIAKKDGKQKLIKLTNKMKRHKKSVDSLSSRESLGDKSDVEKTKKLSKDETKDHSWMRTKILKQKLLNKSHSSDLAIDKKFSTKNNSTKKSHFEIYSMSNFPDRVASDQCLTMTDRYLRDNFAGRLPQPEMHHGSWSSCDVTQCRDEKIYPQNDGGDFLPSPHMMPKNERHMLRDSRQQFTSQSLANDIHNIRRVATVGASRSGSSFSNRQAMYMTSASAEAVGKLSIHLTTGNESTAEGEMKKSKNKKGLILKNPLKKRNKKKNDEEK